MGYGIAIFAVVAIGCVIAGAVAMRRRGDAGDDDTMSDAEFRRIEGFDEP
jgi:hypothetical protein